MIYADISCVSDTRGTKCSEWDVWLKRAILGTFMVIFSILISLVVIPAGSYVAGSTPEGHDTWHVDDNRRAFEYRQQNMTIKKPLAFSGTEVTVAQSITESKKKKSWEEQDDVGKYDRREAQFESVMINSPTVEASKQPYDQ